MVGKSVIFVLSMTVLVAVAACERLPTATPTTSPTPPTSTQVGEVELSRNSQGKLIYKGKSDGAIIEEISYEFTGKGSARTKEFDIRDGYFCRSFNIQSNNNYELWRYQKTSTGLLEFLIDQGFGSSNRSTCTLVYDRIGTQKVSRSGDANGIWAFESGTYGFKVYAADSNAVWEISVCTKGEKEDNNYGC